MVSVPTRTRASVAPGLVVAFATGALALTIGAAACNGVLGIDVATVDPSLQDAGKDAETLPDVAVVDAGPDTPADPYSCAAYCSTVARNCTGGNQEYTSVATCNEMCRYFEPGVAGEQTNDSLACRIYHAREAANDPRGHCQAAGPVAAGTCSSNPCASFCALAFALCKPKNIFPYTNDAECRAACANWPYLKSTDPDAGDAGDIHFSFGNTLNCRIYHLESAFEVGEPTAPTTHCPHVGDPSSACN